MIKTNVTTIWASHGTFLLCQYVFISFFQVHIIPRPQCLGIISKNVDSPLARALNLKEAHSVVIRYIRTYTLESLMISQNLPIGETSLRFVQCQRGKIKFLGFAF